MQEPRRKSQTESRKFFSAMNNKIHARPPAALAVALLITLGFSANPAPAASDFEGRIDMKISNPQSGQDNNAVLVNYIKMPKLRIEMQAALDLSGTAAKSGKNSRRTLP
jgi:hypothetical protein